MKWVPLLCTESASEETQHFNLLTDAVFAFLFESGQSQLNQTQRFALLKW